ncbi:hypothetical protein Goshw_010391 [Gossypium schwendimanii]|uniref:Uncharacterized protein n=1 Tax=Gossypium schwendimanii TaxID=34291 RepID=A0A7J9KRK4_GOSSC|nr:hypothetical protein [Gossypium schwendimanii]
MKPSHGIVKSNFYAVVSSKKMGYGMIAQDSDGFLLGGGGGGGIVEMNLVYLILAVAVDYLVFIVLAGYPVSTVSIDYLVFTVPMNYPMLIALADYAGCHN